MSFKKFDYDNIIIFGGTGTIGTIFTEVLLEDTKHTDIFLITNNEHEIWEARNKYKNNSRIKIIFGDIRDREEIRKIFINLKPERVINCAALKHVDLCEDFVMNTVKTNIFGLENLLYLSNEYGVDDFLQISTDKAVEPISVMGATKMLGERLCREWNKLIDVSVIRLGNVVDSRGSLIPTLEKQLEKGDTLYYTHKEMYRYLITIKELQAFIRIVLDHIVGGEIFIPKLEEVYIFGFIADFALNHKKKNIRIKEMGIRKGEKLREKLYSEFEKIKEYKNYFLVKMED